MKTKLLNKTQFAKSITGGNSQLENNVKTQPNKTDYQTKNINSKSYFQLILAATQYISNNSTNKLDRRILVIKILITGTMMNIKCLRLEIIVPFNTDPIYDKYVDYLTEKFVEKYGGCSIEIFDGYFKSQNGDTVKDHNRKIIVDIRYRNIFEKIDIYIQTRKIYKEAKATLKEEEIYLTLTKTKVYVDFYRDILGIF